MIIIIIIIIIINIIFPPYIKDARMEEKWNYDTNEIQLKTEEEKSDYDIDQMDPECGYELLLFPSIVRKSVGGSISNSPRETDIWKSINFGIHQQEECNPDDLVVDVKIEDERLEYIAPSDATCSQFPFLSPPSVQEFIDADLPDGRRKRKTSTYKKNSIRFSQEEHSVVNDKLVDAKMLIGYIKEEDHDHEQVEIKEKNVKDEAISYAPFDILPTCKNSSAFGFSREEPFDLDDNQIDASMLNEVSIKEEDQDNEDRMNWLEVKEENLEDDTYSGASFDPQSICKKNIFEVCQKEGATMDGTPAHSKILERILLREKTYFESREECLKDKNPSDANGSHCLSPSLPVQESLAARMSKYQKRKVPCDVCNKRFPLIGLMRHMRIHSNEKPFHCEICKKSFSRNCHLKIHMRTHTNEKPYSCVICNNAFSVKATLVNHMRTHSKEKTFQCEICKKNFSGNCHLETHMLTHTKEKPHNCAICKKAFSVKSTLVSHMRTHSKDKTCNICNKSVVK